MVQSPASNTMVLQADIKKDKTSYQMQPEALVSHSGMLPAAALSNFFKAPATPIRSKLPSIGPTLTDSQPSMSKSIHRRNKCLAEVIQTQLLELKKLQDRYRYRSTDRRMLPRRQFNGRNLSSDNTSSDEKTRKDSHSSSDPLWTRSGKLHPNTDKGSQSLGASPLHSSPSTAGIQSLKQASQSSAKISADPLRAPPGALWKNDIHVLQPLETSTESLTLTGTDNQWSHDFMNQEKFQSITKWIHKVEDIQSREGKWTDVISIPDTEPTVSLPSLCL